MVSSFVLAIITNMEDASVQLREALRARLALIADESSRQNARQHMERLRQVSERISALAAELPTTADPQLKHYLARCSYSKALEFLEAGRPNE